MREGVEWESFIYRTAKNVFCMYVECNLIYAPFSLLPDVMERKNSNGFELFAWFMGFIALGRGCAHNNNEIIFHEKFAIFIHDCRSLK